MKTKSRKNKGVRLQNYVAEQISKTLELDKADVKPAIMGESGVDIHLSSKAKKMFPFSIECKNQEKWNIHEFWKQTLSNLIPNTKPLLIIKRNREIPLVVMKFNDLLEIIKGNLK